MTQQQDFSQAVELQNKGKLVEAERLFQQLVKLQPDNVEFIQRWATVLHGLKRFDESVMALRQLCKLCPKDARAYFNLAMVLHVSGQVDEAILELSMAYELNNTDLNIVNQYACLLLEQQQYEQAIPLFKKVQSLAGFSPEATANLGNAFYKGGQLTQAIECFSQAAAAKPGYAYAKHMIARCYADQGRTGDAIALLQNMRSASLLTLDSYLLLSSALALQGKLADAIDACRSGLDLESGSEAAWSQLGYLYQQDELLNEAETAYRNAILYGSGGVDGHVSLAFLLERMSRLEDARNVINEGMRIDPQEPSLLLVNAMVFRREGDFKAAVDVLDQLLALDRSIERVNRAMELSSSHDEEKYIAPLVYYELGQVLDRLGRHDEAYTAFRQANAFRSATAQAKRFEKDAYQREVQQLDSLVTPVLAGTCRVRAEPGEQASIISPVFLVGFPRSGTTLLSNILDSHPDIQVMDEAPVLEPVQKYLASRPAGYPHALNALSDSDLGTMRSLYYKAVSGVIEQKYGALLVDKLPLNLVKVALTRQLFPDARYIFLLRHPCDACLSCFMQNFTPNEAMSNFYSLEDSASLYDLVMRSWTSHSEQLVLPVHRIRYEDILDDFNAQIEQLLSFLDLPWSETVTEFDSHAREKKVISTPSYHQVTQPIYQHAQYRWRSYEKAFESVLPVLAPWIRQFDYE